MMHSKGSTGYSRRVVNFRGAQDGLLRVVQAPSLHPCISDTWEPVASPTHASPKENFLDSYLFALTPWTTNTRVHYPPPQTSSAFYCCSFGIVRWLC